LLSTGWFQEWVRA